MTFTVQNTGGGTLDGAASGLTGPDLSFVGSTDYSLGAGETATVTVRFAPTAVSPYAQTVAFTGGGGASRSVTGIGITPPTLQVTPVDGLSFGTVIVGGATDMAFIVQNTGHGTLTGSASGLTGPDLSFVGSTDYSLGAGETATVTVRFAPTAEAAYSQTVTFTGGAGATRAVTGTGQLPVAATPTLSPTGGTFVASVTVTAECATAGATIYFTTDGSDPTTNSSVYTAPLTLTNSTTVRVMAALTGYADSGVATGEFTVHSDRWAMVWQSTTGSLARWSMQGTNLTSAAPLSPNKAGSGWTVAGFADLDAGGEPNILWRSTTGDLAAWFMSGDTETNWAYLSPKNVATSYRLAGTADLSGDGKDDLIWQGNTGWLYIWYMDGLIMTSGGKLYGSAVDTNWTIVGTGDFNGDGEADLLWQHTSGAMAVWYMDGATRTGGASLTRSMTDANWKVAGLADVNGDGKPDIVWQHNTGYLAVWFMDGVTYTGWSYLNPKQVDPSWKIKAIR